MHWNDPSTPENILAIVTTIVGGEEEARRVIEASKGKEIKEKLTENTEWAVREEAFGLPWFVGKCDPCRVVR